MGDEFLRLISRALSFSCSLEWISLRFEPKKNYLRFESEIQTFYRECYDFLDECGVVRTPEGLLFAAEYCRHLNQLDLSGFTILNDELIRSVCLGCPQLCILIMKNSFKVTGSS